MQFLKKLNIALILLFTFITFAQAETSWITKKKDKDKTEKVTKVVEKKSSEWIKKKEVKENKKKLKEKIKDSKSWITKKSKEKVKDIKDKLKKHKSFDDLPKADFYFAAVVRPLDGSDPKYVYGYVNSDKKSKMFNFQNNSYFSISDGIAYFEDKRNRCEVDSQLGAIGSTMMGEVVLECKKGLQMTGGFRQIGSIGRGDGETSDGDRALFEFFTNKIDAIAKLENYKSSNTQFAHSPQPSTNQMDIEPTGKYYALLIGNSNYNPKNLEFKWTSLTSPVNDVVELEKVLVNKYNFNVTTVKNASRKKIFKAFNELSKITTDEDYVLIYYSGHGDIVSDNSFWIPIDAETEFGMGDWINIRDIEVYLEKKISAHHLALLVDSCYFAIGAKGGNDVKDKSRVYKKLLDRRARLILSSGSKEPVNDTGSGNHSKFAKAIIQSLKNNESVIALREISEQVFLTHDQNRQQPYHVGINSWGHTGGDFIFVAKK